MAQSVSRKCLRHISALVSGQPGIYGAAGSRDDLRRAELCVTPGLLCCPPRGETASSLVFIWSLAGKLVAHMTLGRGGFGWGLLHTRSWGEPGPEPA